MKNTNTPPTDDPSLPSFQRPEFIKQLEWWETCLDCYGGDLNYLPVDRAKKYLPQERNEPDDGYQSRLKRSPYEDYFASTIQGFAGAISGAIFTSKVPQQIEQINQNIDLKGNSIEVFFDDLDVSCLRDRYVFILVDFYRQEVVNRDEELKHPPRPFVRVIDPRQVINWHEDCGKLERLTICEEYHECTGYGYECKTVYRVIEKDTYRLVELQEIKENDKVQWLEVPVLEENGEPIAGQYLNFRGQPLGYCPVVPYCFSIEDWHETSKPEFLSLARQTIKLYQAESDLWQIVHSCCPTPWYRGASLEGLEDSRGNISLGPHDFLFLGNSDNAAVGYLQADPGAIEPIRQVVTDCRDAVKRRGLNNVAGDRPRTATEIRTLFNDIQKQLNRFAVRKASSLDNVFAVICDYLGIDPKAMPRMSVAADISALLTDESAIAVLHKEGLLSLEASVRRLSQLGYTQDPELELNRILAEQGQQTNALATKLQTSDY